MDARHRDSAEAIRSELERGRRDGATFRAALLGVPPPERDAWLDVVLGLGELPDDGPALPDGCVPYLPCAVDALLQIVEHAPVRTADVFVDVGAGVGRAAALVHLLTGATVIGIEVQPHLVLAARELAARLRLARMSCVEGDAAALVGVIPVGSVFLLYCPFSGERLGRVLADLESIARTRTIRVCCVDLPLPACAWLSLESPSSADVAIYRSTLLDAPRATPGAAPLLET